MLPQNQVSKIKLTYEDYKLLPEDKRYELIDGDFFMTPSPLFFHQSISMNLAWFLKNYTHQKNSGMVVAAPMDVYLSEENVVQPDLIYVSQERKNIIERECIKGAPDLVIEILSPSNSNRDLVVKKHLYAKFAVQEYWIADPETKSIEVLSWTETGFKTVQVYPQNSTLASPTLKDLEISLSKVFEE